MAARSRGIRRRPAPWRACLVASQATTLSCPANSIHSEQQNPVLRLSAMFQPPCRAWTPSDLRIVSFIGSKAARQTPLSQGGVGIIPDPPHLFFKSVLFIDTPYPDNSPGCRVNPKQGKNIQLNSHYVQTGKNKTGPLMKKRTCPKKNDCKITDAPGQVVRSPDQQPADSWNDPDHPPPCRE